MARALADQTGWPVLKLDPIKNPFLLALPPAALGAGGGLAALALALNPPFTPGR